MSSQTNSSEASVAGSVAMLFFNNKVNAIIGNNVPINLDGTSYDTWKDLNGNVWYLRGNKVYKLAENGLLVDAGFSSDVIGGATRIDAAVAAAEAAAQNGQTVSDDIARLAASRSTEAIGESDHYRR